MSTTFSQALIRSGFGAISNSMALRAQGIYSFADFLIKVINLVSVRISRLPPSPRFPFGYGKIQFFVPFVVGVTVVIGASFLLYKNVHGLGDTIREVPSAIALICVVLSVIAGEIMFRYLDCVGKENNNLLIKAAALDNRTDVYSSLTVLSGVVLSLLGWSNADHWAAIGVALLVIRMGAYNAYTGFNSLMDASISTETLEKIELMARKTPHILEVEYIRGRNIGDTFEIAMQLAIDDRLSLEESHHTLAELKKRIKGSFEHISHVYLEVTPRAKPRSEVMDAFMEAVDD